jgi:colanic acid biosynthesis glycosyl transferase WcaI
VPKKIAVLYHYMHPDDVVSARHFDGFCEGLVKRGWQVEAMPCNRGCRDETRQSPRHSRWHNIEFNRVWRPKLRQASTGGRVLNALWMIGAWSRIGLRRKSAMPDVVMIGTDPIFSVMAAVAIKAMRPTARIVHWCFDLYPEAAVADGVLSPDSLFVKSGKWLLRRAYKSCDVIADVGSCMRARLDAYRPSARRATLTPWALFEPTHPVAADPETRRSLFHGASLGLLYSGNVGRAHSYEEFLALARRLRSQDAHFCFSVRGNRAAELRDAVRVDDANIGFADFASESELGQRLSAADIHLVSLQAGWTGVVVPSKFFGCLAAGRPVIFAGSRQSCIAGWIAEHNVGWVLDGESMESVANDIIRLAKEPERLRSLQAHCHSVYHDHFRMELVMDAWSKELFALVA